MSAVARATEIEDDDGYPASGTFPIVSTVVLEPVFDLTSALLEACGEPANVTRLETPRLVRRRAR